MTRQMSRTVLLFLTTKSTSTEFRNVSFTACQMQQQQVKYLDLILDFKLNWRANQAIRVRKPACAAVKLLRPKILSYSTVI